MPTLPREPLLQPRRQVLSMLSRTLPMEMPSLIGLQGLIRKVRLMCSWTLAQQNELNPSKSNGSIQLRRTFSRFIFPLHGLCLSCDAPGIRAAGGKRRQVDKCIQHVRQQFASNQVRRACCFGHCPPDPYDKGGLRVWGAFAWLTCTCGPSNLFASLTPHLATAAGIQCKPLSARGWCALRHLWLACPALLSKIFEFLLARHVPLCKIAPRLKTTPTQETNSSCMQLLPAHVCDFGGPVRNVLPGLPCPSLTHAPRQLQKIMQRSWDGRRHISATCLPNFMPPCLLLRLVASKPQC